MRTPAPRLVLGGQVHNSSSSSLPSIGAAFAHVRAMNGNTVIAPLSWALTEPTEGSFDFTLLDGMLCVAEQHDLRLVLVWFGAFKNAASTYAPRWVRADPGRFPRAEVDGTVRTAFSYAGATAKPVLSVFSPALREADALAFEAVLLRLVKTDLRGTVVMVQVENEMGLLGDSRDRSPIAQAAWCAPVPDTVLAQLSSPALEGSMAWHLWDEQGRAATGTWADVLGDTADAHEIFMAFAFAGYAEELAGRGRRVKDIPMYVNAWLGPQPGQERPGQWPSGGPASRVLGVWRAAAPSLALIGPDIYVDDADSAMLTYAAGGHPLFIPECRLSAAELVRAVGTYQAIGWSAFGIDDANPDGQIAQTLAHLTALDGAIVAAGRSGGLAAVVIEPGSEHVEVHLGETTITARGTLPLLQRMLLDAGVRVPDPVLDLPDETRPGAPVPTPGERRPFGLIVQESPDTYVVVGQGLTLDFATAGQVTEVDTVEELLVRDERLVPGRILNGDERLRVLPTERVGAARITCLRRPLVQDARI